jgi:hypothetical protein
MRICEDNYGILRRAEDMLGTDYEINITNDDECKGFIDDDSVVEMIDDLCTEIDRLKEELDDQKDYYEEQIRECYKPISPYEFYGVSENVFH